jgi:hypothetical protein
MKFLWLTCLVLGVCFLALQLFWPHSEEKGDGFVICAALFISYCAYRWRIGRELFLRGGKNQVVTPPSDTSR